MKRLFISDLDGTLFDPAAEIADKTAEVINSLVEKGMNFTFATARSVYSAKPMTEKLKINAPCILMNGVSIYDLQNDRYLRNEFIPEDASAEIIRIFESHDVRCFVYMIKDGLLTAYFTEMTSEVMRQFAEERKRKFRKPFVQCSRFVPDKDIVYFTTTGEHDVLLPLKEELEAVGGADSAFYEDTYTGKWYLEVFSHRASKYNGIKYLREHCGFEHITCFGDNLNDIPMFQASDERIAVENAKPELKELADHIVPANTENGVARWLLDNVEL